jgi:ADP-ribosylglycohydrolase
MDKYHKEYIKYSKRYTTHKLARSVINNELDKDKVMGTIAGCIFGDAFGGRYEFLVKTEADKKLEEDKLSDGSYPIKGGGPFDIMAGQVTDDSEMMFGLMDSLIEMGRYSQEDVAKKYIRWYKTEPIDKGFTIGRAINTRKIADNSTDMIDNAKEMNKHSASNGALMKISPIGAFGVILTDEELLEVVQKECDLTHPNSLVKDICYVYCIAIKYSILGLTKEDIFKMMLLKATHVRTKIILKDAMISADPCFIIEDIKRKEDYICTDNIKFQGYIGIAIQNAIYEFMHSDNPSKSIVRVARRGGDTDTNCAIAGALLGAYYGANSFDSNWLDTVKNASDNVKRYKDYPFLNPYEEMQVKGELFYALVKAKKIEIFKE